MLIQLCVIFVEMRIFAALSASVMLMAMTMAARIPDQPGKLYDISCPDPAGACIYKCPTRSSKDPSGHYNFPYWQDVLQWQKDDPACDASRNLQCIKKSNNAQTEAGIKGGYFYVETGVSTVNGNKLFDVKNVWIDYDDGAQHFKCDLLLSSL